MPQSSYGLVFWGGRDITQIFDRGCIPVKANLGLGNASKGELFEVPRDTGVSLTPLVMFDILNTTAFCRAAIC